MNKCIPRVTWDDTMAALYCEHHGKVGEWCRKAAGSPAAVNTLFEKAWNEHQQGMTLGTFEEWWRDCRAISVPGIQEYQARAMFRSVKAFLNKAGVLH